MNKWSDILAGLAGVAFLLLMFGMYGFIAWVLLRDFGVI